MAEHGRTQESGAIVTRPTGHVAPAILTLALLAPVSTAPAGQELPRDETAVRQALDAVARLGQPGAHFEIHETPNYVITYDGKREMAVERGRMLEQLQHHYFKFLKQAKIEHRSLQHKLVVLVFEREPEFLQYARQDGYPVQAGGDTYLQGYYNSATNRAAFFNQRGGGAYERTKLSLQRMADSLSAVPGSRNTPVRVEGPDGIRHTTKGQLARELMLMKKQLIDHFAQENRTVTQHEGAHQLAFNAGLQKRGAIYPFWVSEGLACMFESPGGGKRYGAFWVNPKRLSAYRDLRDRGMTLGIEALVTLPPDSRENLLDLYTESWALFYFLAKTRPEELSAYLKDQTVRERAAEFDAPAEGALFCKHFGPLDDKLEHEWERFLRRLRIK